MWGIKELKGFCIVLSMSLLGIACSDVQFAPGPPPQERSSNGGGSDSNDGSDSKGESYNETFYVDPSNGTRKVDVLFIVDNSSSMLEEQQKMGERLSSFIDYLSMADWQIGITTTDVSNGNYGLKGSLLTFAGTQTKVLTPQIPNYESAFLQTVVREETNNCSSGCPSVTEQPMKASILAMSKHQGVNQGFFRDGADLAIVILSDEDEMSTGPSNATRGNDVIDAFHQTFGAEKKMTAYGIIVKPDDLSCQSQQAGGANQAGNLLADFVQQTGGVLGSICDTDYSQNLQRIGERVQQTLSSIELKVVPDPSTLRLVFTPVDSTSAYTMSGKTIYFDDPPPEGTQINVFYESLERQTQDNSNDDDQGDD